MENMTHISTTALWLFPRFVSSHAYAIYAQAHSLSQSDIRPESAHAPKPYHIVKKDAGVPNLDTERLFAKKTHEGSF